MHNFAGLDMEVLNQSSPRGVVPRGAMKPPDFGRSVNPISTKGGRLCPPYNTGISSISVLPTALNILLPVYQADGTIILIGS